MTASMMFDNDRWVKKNHEYLTLCIKQTKDLLGDYLSQKKDKHKKGCSTPSSQSCSCEKHIRWDDEVSPPAIEYLSKVFCLSSFERSVLILCAAVELDPEVASMVASVNDNKNSTTTTVSTTAQYPTFSLALSLFPDAHWSALAPISPLRKFRLVDLAGFPQAQLVRCPLQIQERILHYLVGLSYLETSLEGIVEPVYIETHESESHKAIADSILHMWKGGQNASHIQLIGTDETSNRAVAGLVCNILGINLWQITGDQMPLRIDEIESLVQLCVRESTLSNAAIYIPSVSELETTAQKSVRLFSRGFAGPLFMSSSVQLPADHLAPAAANAPGHHPILTVDVQKPTKSEQQLLWKMVVADGADLKDISIKGFDDKDIAKLVNQFNLSYNSIHSAASNAMMETLSDKTPLFKALWSACKREASPRLVELAQRVIPKASMDDLILTDREKHLLKNIVMNVRQRHKVYEEWGFGMVSDRGIGITALFFRRQRDRQNDGRRGDSK